MTEHPVTSCHGSWHCLPKWQKKVRKYLWRAVRGIPDEILLLLIRVDHWVTDGLEWFFHLQWVLTKHFNLPPIRTWTVQSQRIKEQLFKNNKLQQPWKCGIQCFSTWTEMEVILDCIQFIYSFIVWDKLGWGNGHLIIVEGQQHFEIAFVIWFEENRAVTDT